MSLTQPLQLLVGAAHGRGWEGEPPRLAVRRCQAPSPQGRVLFGGRAPSQQVRAGFPAQPGAAGPQGGRAPGQQPACLGCARGSSPSSLAGLLLLPGSARPAGLGLGSLGSRGPGSAGPGRMGMAVRRGAPGWEGERCPPSHRQGRWLPLFGRHLTEAIIVYFL